MVWDGVLVSDNCTVSDKMEATEPDSIYAYARLNHKSRRDGSAVQAVCNGKRLEH